jgi:hypothetical protein
MIHLTLLMVTVLSSTQSAYGTQTDLKTRVAQQVERIKLISGNSENSSSSTSIEDSALASRTSSRSLSCESNVPFHVLVRVHRRVIHHVSHCVFLFFLAPAMYSEPDRL